MVSSALSAALALFGLGPASQKPVFGAPLLQQLSMDSSTINLHQNDSFSHANQANPPDQCYVEPYTATPEPNILFPPFNQEEANIYRYRQQQGVNLGSWFVHENWMHPTLFACASGNKESEHDIATGWGSKTSARALLERHWDTFISPSDFDYLAGIGINTVRLPIGYWSLGPDFCKGTPFEPVADVYTNSWSRVLRAINWASAAGIGVLVDLHGAPGSQNGQSHSGISDHKARLFDSEDNKAKTILVLQHLAQQLSDITNVVGIQILNEPNDHPTLPAFYDAAITAMNCSLPKYIHDGFHLAKYSEYNSHRQDFTVVDHHSYFVFTDSDNNESASDHSNDVATLITTELAKSSSQQRGNLIIGEWSCALSPQSMKKENNPEASQKDFCTGQMDVYRDNTAGWSFWSYMKEECQTDPGWCFKSAVGNKLPASFHSYPSAASKSLDNIRALTGQMSSNPQDLPPRTSAAGVRQTIDPIRRRQTSIHHRHLHRRELLGSQDGPIAYRTGYRDGYDTALKFATFKSKVGFKQQCMMDNCGEVGDPFKSIEAHDEYADGYLKGLKEGEHTVEATLNPL